MKSIQKEFHLILLLDRVVLLGWPFLENVNIFLTENSEN